jgi:hypothetical protein
MILISLISVIIILSLLLINSLGLFAKLRASIAKIWYNGGKKDQSSLSIDDRGVTSLKLEAQKINEFNGDYEQWPKWKSRTECAFNGSGYDKILTNEQFAKSNPKMNTIVYSQLAVATVDGSAHHLVKQHEDERDGYKAWNSLLEWFDGDNIRNETADMIRARLQALTLHPGMTASDYVNKYMMRFQELQRIPGEGMSIGHATQLFLGNIQDDRYEMTVKYLRNADAKLHECVTAIRKEECDQLRKRAAKRKLNATIRRYRENGDYTTTEDSNIEDENHTTPKKIRRLKGTFETNDRGFLSIPNDQWAKLDDTDKAFVQKYNAKVKHKEPLNALKVPDGVIIKNKSRRNQSVTTSDETDDKDIDKSSPPPAKKHKKRHKTHYFCFTTHEQR